MRQSWKWAAGVLALALIAGGLWFFTRAGRAPLTQREIATQILAEHVRKAVSPKSVVVISNPYSQMSGRTPAAQAFQKASEAGLRKGFGDGVELKLAFPQMKPEASRDPTSVYVDPNTTTPLSFLITVDAFEQIAREHPQADVFVSLV